MAAPLYIVFLVGLAMLFNLSNAWEVSEQYLGDDLIAVNIAEMPESGVRRVISVVTHHEIMSLWHFKMQFFRSFHLFRQIRLF